MVNSDIYSSHCTLKTGTGTEIKKPVVEVKVVKKEAQTFNGVSYPNGFPPEKTIVKC